MPLIWGIHSGDGSSYYLLRMIRVARLLLKDIHQGLMGTNSRLNPKLQDHARDVDLIVSKDGAGAMKQTESDGI